MPDSFTHLHLHTEFSMLDGAARVGDVVAKAAADGQPAIGITDHGNMYGVLDFYRACQDAGIKPIIGSELYQAYESRTERPARRGRQDDGGGDTDGGRKAYYHLIALAENNVGYRNLIQLSSRAYLEGYYMKPKVDWELLEAHKEGLIVTSGCLGGQVLQALLQGNEKDALEKAARFQDIFGRDNFFVEIQDHGIAEQRAYQSAAARDRPQDPGSASRHQRQPLHELRGPRGARRAPVRADRCAHERSRSLQVPRRPALPQDGRRDARACSTRCPRRATTRCGSPSAATSRSSSARCSCRTSRSPRASPIRRRTCSTSRSRVPASGGASRSPTRSSNGWRSSSRSSATWGSARTSSSCGTSSPTPATRNIRVGPGRGSAAGCAVAYCLRITDLDPIKYDLLFERFLNPSRISMPDIDMDFDSRYRDEMIRYAAERYGRDRVAQIVTFSTIKARAAVRDAARVLGYPYAVGDKVAKAMPPLVMGRDTPLYACLEEHPKFADGYKMASELRDMYNTDQDLKRVIEVAKGLEGLRRQDGIHAAAVVITKDPLTDYLPIQRKPEAGQDPADAPVVTQYEMHGVEDLGLLKMDFLGLRNLDVISDTIDLVRQTRGVELDIDNVDLDDEPTYELLRKGDSIGVFQLEGGPMRALMRSLAPDSFEDVAALVALYRPGPMAANMHNDYADRKNGRKPIEYLHPDARGDPGRHLRPHDLPGVGHADRAEVRRLLTCRGGQPSQGVPSGRHEDPHEEAWLRSDRAGDVAVRPPGADHRHDFGDHPIRRGRRRLVSRNEAGLPPHDLDRLRDRSDRRTTRSWSWTSGASSATSRWASSWPWHRRHAPMAAVASAMPKSIWRRCSSLRATPQT